MWSLRNTQQTLAWAQALAVVVMATHLTKVPRQSSIRSPVEEDFLVVTSTADAGLLPLGDGTGGGSRLLVALIGSHLWLPQ